MSVIPDEQVESGRCNAMIRDSNSLFAGTVRCGRPMFDGIHDPLGFRRCYTDRDHVHPFDNVPVCDGEDPEYEVIEP